MAPNLLRTSPVSELPEDIWICICQYLTDDQILGMYSVNRPLYRIAMKLRYREISIGKLRGVGSEETLKCLYTLEDPDLSGYPRSLRFMPTRLQSSDEDPEATPVDAAAFGGTAQLAVIKRVAARFMEKARSPNGLPRPTSPPSPTRSRCIVRLMRNNTAHDLESLISTLGQLIDLKIHWPDASGTTPVSANWSISLLSPGWGAFGSNLRSMTLSGSITTWEQVLSHQLHLEKLETLSIRAETGFKNANDDTYAIRLVLAPFIRRHSGTLKTLSFVSHLLVDLSAFYDGAGRLPCLKSLEIEQPYQPPGRNHAETLNQFLIRHVDTLISFRWMFTTPSDGQHIAANRLEWFEQSPYHLTLPKLRELHLGFPALPKLDLFEGTLFYSARHTQTLTKLSLDGSTLTLPQFHELLLLVGSKLVQELSISLDILTSAVFINLSNKFPGLRVLRLAYSLVGRQKSPSEPALVDPTAGGILKIPNVSVVKMWQFRQDMASLVLSEWCVEMLYVRRSVDRSWREYRAEQVGRFIVKSLPRVGFVNGVYRDVFLHL